MIKAKEFRIVKEVKGVMACDVSPVAMFLLKESSFFKKKSMRFLQIQRLFVLQDIYPATCPIVYSFNSVQIVNKMLYTMKISE